MQIALQARSCYLSSFRLSDCLQKWHTVWQYLRWGRIAVRYSLSLVLHEIRLRSLASTPIFLLAFLQMSLMCLVKLSWSFMFTPRILKSAVGLNFWLLMSRVYTNPLLPCQCLEASLLKLGTSLGWHGCQQFRSTLLDVINR